MSYRQDNNIIAFRALMILLLIVFGLQDMSAQVKLKFSIANFGLDPFDLSARDRQYEKYDGNGERYAIIKVSSNNPNDNLNEYNFNFGNIKHFVEEHDGILWVYVQRNAKLVSITREGYAPINRYDLHTTIESGKNYVMSITSEAKKIYTQMVQFNVSPADSKAVVMVKSSKAGSQEELFGNIDVDGAVARSLEYGTYSYKVLADNYHSAEGRFTLNDRSETFVENIELNPNFSEITFRVAGDADIYVNGEKKGTGRWTGILKSGGYQVECRKDNHKPSTQYVLVEENDSHTIDLVAPEPIIGTVSVISNPLGADVWIDGRNYGRTPQSLELLVGQHTMYVSKDGYKKSEIQPFTVQADKTVEVNVELTRVANVTISSNPSQSKVYVDGEFVGSTPYTYSGRIGSHTLKISHDGYKTIMKKVEFGDEEQLTFNLKKQYVKKSDFYMAVGVGGDPSLLVTADASIGTHIANFNIEIGYSYCFQSSPEIYWVYIGEDNSYGIDGDVCEYYPSWILDGKIGYGVIMGPRFKLTPQVGYHYTRLAESGAFRVQGANCSGVSVGMRLYCAVSSHFGVSFTPEYVISVYKSDGFKILSDVSSKIKYMGEGFNAKFALVVSF